MTAESLREVASVTGGLVVGGGGEDRLPAGYSIDTRTLKPGDLFFAIVGPKQDGHRFAAEAVLKGAVAIVVSDQAAIPEGCAAVIVKDTTRALQDLAAGRRRNHRAKVVGITGSAGKTTTKEMTRHVLEGSHNVMASRGNLNNLFGLPLSLLDLDERHDVAILEMGMSTHGELARLAEIADPDVGVLTNVSGAHLQYFADLDDYASAKAELFEGMRPGTTGLFNSDDPRCLRIAAAFRGRACTFGVDPGSEFRASAYRSEGMLGSTFELHHEGRSRAVRLRFAGIHQAMNATAALATGVLLGAGLDSMIARIAEMEPQMMRGRSHGLRGGGRLLDDSYNANPAAMLAALTVLSETTPNPPGRRVAVLGDMLELGAESPARHREIGARLHGAGVGVAWLVGPLMTDAAETARAGGLSDVRTAATAAEAARGVVEGIRPGDVILVKGSRGIGLERVTRAVLDALGDEQDPGGGH